MGNLRLQEQNLLTGTRSKVQREDLNLGPHPSTVHLLSLLEGNTGKKAGDFTDVPRRCLRNSHHSGGKLRGRRDVGGQKANDYYFHLPRASHALQLPFYLLVYTGHLLPRGGKSSTNRSWEDTGSETERTAAWAVAPRPHLKTQHYFDHCRNRHHASAQNAGWQGASKSNSYETFPVSPVICVNTLRTIITSYFLHDYLPQNVP